MKPLKIATTVFAVLMLYSFAFGQPTRATPSPTIAQQLTGTISDGICRGHHNRKAATPFGCSIKCVREGARYVLVVGDSVYALEGHTADVEKFAGDQATITGHVSGNNISVDSVTKAQKAAKSGSRTDS